MERHGDVIKSRSSRPGRDRRPTGEFGGSRVGKCRGTKRRSTPVEHPNFQRYSLDERFLLCIRAYRAHPRFPKDLIPSNIASGALAEQPDVMGQEGDILRLEGRYLGVDVVNAEREARKAKIVERRISDADLRRIEPLHQVDRHAGRNRAREMHHGQMAAWQIERAGRPARRCAVSMALDWLRDTGAKIGRILRPMLVRAAWVDLCPLNILRKAARSGLTICPTFREYQTAGSRAKKYATKFHSALMRRAGRSPCRLSPLPCTGASRRTASTALPADASPRDLHDGYSGSIESRL